MVPGHLTAVTQTRGMSDIHVSQLNDAIQGMR